MIKADHIQSIITPLQRRDLSFFGGVLYIRKPISFSIAHGNTNYNIKIPRQNIKINDVNFWVTIDVDCTSAKTTVKIIEEDPSDYGNDFPNTPTEGQRFFHRLARKNFIRRCNEWIETISINLCRVESAKITEIYNRSSQVELDNSPHVAGDIQFKDGLAPKKVDTQHGFYFITDNDLLLLGLNDVKSSNLEGIQAKHIAGTNISKYDLLIRAPGYGVIRASNVSLNYPVIGMAMADCVSGDRCPIKESGFIENTQWRWSDPPNTKLYCDVNGKITRTPDWSANTIQEIGYIVDIDIIYLDPKPKVVINTLNPLV